MKRSFAVILAVVMMAAATGCGHTHEFTEATCTEPKTCTECGETEGEPLPHSFSDATCTEPKTCTVCGATEGEPLGHSCSIGVCSGCGEFINAEAIFDIIDAEKSASTYWDTANQYVAAANDSGTLDGMYENYCSAAEYILTYQSRLIKPINICEKYPALGTLKNKLYAVRNYNISEPRSSGRDDLAAFIEDLIEISTLQSDYAKEMMNWLNKMKQ